MTSCPDCAFPASARLRTNLRSLNLIWESEPTASAGREEARHGGHHPGDHEGRVPEARVAWQMSSVKMRAQRLFLDFALALPCGLAEGRCFLLDIGHWRDASRWKLRFSQGDDEGVSALDPHLSFQGWRQAPVGLSS